MSNIEKYLEKKRVVFKKRKISENNVSSPHISKKIDVTTSKNNVKSVESYPLVALNNRKQLTTSSVPTMSSTKEKQTFDEFLNTEDKENFSEMDTFLNMDFDSWEDDLIEESESYNLDLSEPRHCKILNVTNLKSKICLTLMSTKDHQKCLCLVSGFWLYSNLKVNDKVYITAKIIDNTWIINNEHGLLVFEPDILVSSTLLSGSLWCKRKSLLQERYRGFYSTNQPMLIGSVIHSTFQSALRMGISDITKIEEIARKCMNKKVVIKALYECGISLKTLESSVFNYIPKMNDFISYYIESSSKSTKNNNWKGKIKTIDDIEENIWCPELGLKGKIDVTITSTEQVMPLEIKTGKATVSLAHHTQIMLYIMMMKVLGYKVTSGLILYLSENIVKEITSSQNEEKDLIRLRNELVGYLTKAPSSKDDLILPPELPEPVNEASCSNCSYKNICTALAHYTDENITSKQHLKKIQEETLQYIDPIHIEYFVKWTCMLITENSLNFNKKDAKEIYLVPSEEREQNGRCITNLIISQVSKEIDEMIQHSFERINDSTFNFLDSGIVTNNYVIVSTKKRYAIAAGLVNNITSTSISINLNINLINKYQNQSFIIDTYDSSTMGQTFQFSSLALLLDNTPKAENLRKIIIDKASPTFKSTLPKIIGTKGKSILKRLNIVQQRAVLKAITANEYFLIKGMPGTGKTSTIVALIQLLNELGKTVLITSHTNSAVDNVCLKLLAFGVKFLRLGSESKIHKDLLEYSEHYVTKNCLTPKDYEDVYNNAQILAVTCFASGHPVLTKRTLDFCIVDESTQVLQSSVIRPLYACKTFILIGDPDQLPAVVKNAKARDLGMSESLFERLYKTEATVALNINYRMNKTITSLANYLTYNGELQVGNENVGNATISINMNVLEDFYKKDNWIFKTLDTSLEKSVLFLDTGPVWNLSQEIHWKINKNYTDSQCDENNSKVNIYEAGVIFKLVKALLKNGIKSNTIAVIASYRHQVEQLSILLENYFIEVNTVDQIQGKDKNVIIYSCGASKDITDFSTGANDILEDKRRLNVAITRAKHKLIIVGDVQTLLIYSPFKKLLSFVDNNVIKLTECSDFLWEKILDLDSH